MFKWQAAAIAASAIVTVGAIAAAIGQEHTTTAASGMSIGQTMTSTTPPTTPPVTLASPMVKAPKPKGF
jgi:hypothetical protein